MFLRNMFSTLFTISKYQKQIKCTRSEISINLSFYVYIIPKRNNYSSNSNNKKKENGYNLKIGHSKYISELSAKFQNEYILFVFGI
jgi:hypothetical protein